VSSPHPLYATAAHEAGHVVVGFLLGFDSPGCVSIEPGESFSGVAFAGTAPTPQVDIEPPRSLFWEPPLWLRDPERRARDELRVVVSLAGVLAEGIYGAPPLGEGYQRTSEPTLPSEDMRETHDLPLEERQDLEEAKARPGLTDSEKIAQVMDDLHGRADFRLAAAHVEYLEHVTRSLLTSSYGRLAVPMIRDALLAHRSLAADYWRNLCQRAQVRAASLDEEEEQAFAASAAQAAAMAEAGG
jgi:hypothetical protein